MSIQLCRAHKEKFISRINALTPQSRGRFGKLTVDGMLVHLRVTLELALGEISAKDQSNIFTRTVFYVVAYKLLPWPKGKIKVGDEFTPAPQNAFEEERKQLLQTIDRFIETAEREPSRTGLHPLFGPKSLREWQKMHAKHMNHHFEQFGV